MPPEQFDPIPGMQHPSPDELAAASVIAPNRPKFPCCGTRRSLSHCACAGAGNAREPERKYAHGPTSRERAAMLDVTAAGARRLFTSPRSAHARERWAERRLSSGLFV